MFESLIYNKMIFMIFFCLDMREETQRLKKEREAIEREKAELMALTRGEGNRGNT